MFSLDGILDKVTTFYRHSPPTQTYGLALMDFMGQYMFWMAAMTYTYKISPKNIVATMVAVVTSVTYTIGEMTFGDNFKTLISCDSVKKNLISGMGLGGSLVGPLTNIAHLTLPQVFYATAITMSATAICCRLIFNCLQKYEDDLIDQRNACPQESSKDGFQFEREYI